MKVSALCLRLSKGRSENSASELYFPHPVCFPFSAERLTKYTRQNQNKNQNSTTNYEKTSMWETFTRDMDSRKNFKHKAREQIFAGTLHVCTKVFSVQNV